MSKSCENCGRRGWEEEEELETGAAWEGGEIGEIGRKWGESPTRNGSLESSLSGVRKWDVLWIFSISFWILWKYFEKEQPNLWHWRLLFLLFVACLLAD